MCRKGNLGILKKLLEKAKDQRMYCSKKGKSTLSSDCEAVLLARAKEVNIVNIVKAMVCIATTRDDNYASNASQGWYPVMYAVKAGHVELVKECFDKVEHALTTKVYCVAHFSACIPV